MKRVKGLLVAMKEWTLTQIPYSENEEANLLAKMASTSPMNIIRCIPVELLCRPNVKKPQAFSVTMCDKSTWKDDIIAYLLKEKLLEDKVKVSRMWCKAVVYTVIGD